MSWYMEDIALDLLEMEDGYSEYKYRKPWNNPLPDNLQEALRLFSQNVRKNHRLYYS